MHELLSAAPASTAETTLWDIAQQVATFLVALGAIYMTVIRPTIRRLHASWRESIAAVVEQQRRQGETLQRVEHQVHPNSGKSAHDYARKAFEMSSRSYEAATAANAASADNAAAIAQLGSQVAQQTYRVRLIHSELSDHMRDVVDRRRLDREVLAEQGVDLPVAPVEHNVDQEVPG